MVDALSSGGSECMLVGVQLPPLAPWVNPSGTLKFQRFGGVFCIRKRFKYKKNIRIETTTTPIHTDLERFTVLFTSDMSASRSCSKRSAYTSNVMAADEWPSIRCTAFTFAPE